jgi:hypothetical protein
LKRNRVIYTPVPNAMAFWREMRRVHGDLIMETAERNWFDLTVDF